MSGRNGCLWCYGTVPTTKPRAIVSCCAMPTPESSSPVSMLSLIGPLPVISVTTPLDTRLDDLLNQHFAGRVVRKDLTKLVKEGANVPVYVLEYLLGTYCASNDEEVIQEGLQTVKRILAENYVRP